jgi:hypothetical protein
MILRLHNNRFDSAPQALFQLPGAARINLQDNPLSPPALVELTQQSGTPLIQFDMPEAETAARQETDSQDTASRQPTTEFERAVRRYCSHIGPEQIRSLEHTENADSFTALLNRLGNTAEGRMNGFSDRVAAVIQTLAGADSAELRTNCFSQAREGLASCDDRVAITFSDIEVACKVHRILRDGGGQAEIVQLLKGLFRMNALNNFARNDMARRQGHVDEIEVLLAYRVGLREELDLPYETRAMIFTACAHVDRAALNRAKEHVLDLERTDNKRALVEFAVEQPFWNTFLENNPEFQREYERLVTIFNERLEQLDDSNEGDYIRECNTLAADREAQIKALQRTLTRRMMGS